MTVSVNVQNVDEFDEAEAMSPQNPITEILLSYFGITLLSHVVKRFEDTFVSPPEAVPLCMSDVNAI